MKATKKFNNDKVNKFKTYGLALGLMTVTATYIWASSHDKKVSQEVNNSPPRPTLSTVLDTANDVRRKPVNESKNALSFLTQAKPKIDLVFALDTTSSMSGMINAAKEKIWSIASTMASAQPSPDIRIGLVAFRDRGDNYVTKVIELTSDLDTIYSHLLSFKAQGGGDGPESVNAALNDAITKMQWNQEPNSYKAVFLVGDAPAHHDYQDDVPFIDSIKVANEKGILVNTIQAGRNAETQKEWKQIAALGAGANFQVEQSGGAIAVSTPFDKEIAETSIEMDKTKLYYGSKLAKQKGVQSKRLREELYEKSSISSLARRAKYNTSESGRTNVAEAEDLVTALANKRVELDEITSEELPEVMKTMKLAEQKAYVEIAIKKRLAAKQKIKALSEKRDAFIKKELSKRKDVSTSLDAQLLGVLKEQTQKKGLSYSEAEGSF